ncbi:hypothetical protein [Nonomuraea typhae]|uniref:hypothetical protein n=1 Tax=Nonomuraea typhae TaxID=2603600 RepID=UPI0012F88CAB|nr:hypothetical protein [Nonomuraea typhae]
MTRLQPLPGKGGGRYATEWIEHPGGACTTRTVMEEGAIRCADVVPPNCRTVDDRRRFHLYRDVPGSNPTGVPIKSTGSMAGRSVVAGNLVLRQYGVGMGAYLLERLG